MISQQLKLTLAKAWSIIAQHTIKTCLPLSIHTIDAILLLANTENWQQNNISTVRLWSRLTLMWIVKCVPFNNHNKYEERQLLAFHDNDDLNFLRIKPMRLFFIL